MKNPYSRLLINIGLLFTGLLAAYSGFLIQLSYHMGHHGIIDFNKMILGVSYSGWSNIHKMSILLLSAFMSFHIVQHRTSYKTIIKNNLVVKNKQIFMLLVIFIFVAITGYIPWIIDLTGKDQIVRNNFLETHDKLTMVLFIFIVLHVAKRFKWFIKTLKKVRNN